MNANMGLLLTLTEPPAAMEEEFNAWYDTEHLAERLSIAGFLGARRWRRDCAPGEGKYLATYELTSPGVLQTPGYLAHVGDNFTPWSKRCLGALRLFRRWACEQTVPGNRLPDEKARALYLACDDVPAAHEQEFDRWYDMEQLPLRLQVPGVLSARRFRASAGEPAHIAIYDLAGEDVTQQTAWLDAGRTEWSMRVGEMTKGCATIRAVFRAY